MTDTDAVKFHLHLPRSVYDRLEPFTREAGVTRPAIVLEAVNDWIDRRGDDALDLRFGHRLKRISNELERNGRMASIQLESLGLFIRYMLAVNPPLPEDDLAARAIARDRFAAFVERVGQQLANGKFSLVPEEDQ